MSLRVGVLGLGFMGSTHVGAWQKVPQASLVAVCSSVEAKLQGDLRGISGNVAGASERHDFSHLKKYSRIDQLLSDPDIDAVDICLPTYLHADVARCALEAGKHVLVEKPLAISATAAAELLDVYRRSGRILMAAQVVRFFPQYGRLHDLLLSGRLGAVRSATLRRRCAAPTWSEWLHAVEKSGGGIHDLLIHDIDFCLWTFGVPQAVSATGYGSLAEGVDTITANLHYEHIPSVVIAGGWHTGRDYPFSMGYTVVSEAGTYEFDSQRSSEVMFHPVSGKTHVEPPESVDGYALELSYFADCCLNEQQPDFCPPEDSARAVQLAVLLLEARSRKGEKIPCQI